MDELQDLEVMQAYREVFTSFPGRRVLAHMLSELHFFDTILVDPGEIALSNYARILLDRIGIWRAENVGKIVDHIIGISPDIRRDGNGEGQQQK